jgi:hypothetical protein
MKFFNLVIHKKILPNCIYESGISHFRADQILNIFRRKFVHFNPNRTRGGLIEIVHLQAFDGGASAGSFADDFGFVGAEVEMVVPVLRSWVEEFDGFSREIINGFGFRGFVGVAFAAGEPEVFFCGFAA